MMRIYTNIPLDHPCLKELEKSLAKRGIIWKTVPVSSYNFQEQFREMMAISSFFTEESIAFLVVGIKYEFEEPVDHNDLYSGNFTYCENLVFAGFMPHLGLFENKKKKTRTGLSSRMGGLDYIPEEKWLNTLFSQLKELVPQTPIRKTNDK